MTRPTSDTKSFSSLIQVVADLRGPEGCPWDLEQTHQSLAPYTIEEAYELAELLDQFGMRTITDSVNLDPKNDVGRLDSRLKDELGDLLFQVMLHCQLAHERKAFSMSDVIEHLKEKLIRRHPHVFADVKIKNVEEVWNNWEQIKALEKQTAKNQTPDRIFDFPKNLPALQRAYKIGLKTQKKKFDWSTTQEVEEKFQEEWGELKEALQLQNEQSIIDEFGDVLFTLAQLARHLGFEPEQALRKANHKFESRFECMMSLAQERDLNWENLPNSDKESLWNDAKERTKS